MTLLFFRLAAFPWEFMWSFFKSLTWQALLGMTNRLLENASALLSIKCRHLAVNLALCCTRNQSSTNTNLHFKTVPQKLKCNLVMMFKHWSTFLCADRLCDQNIMASKEDFLLFLLQLANKKINKAFFHKKKQFQQNQTFSLLSSKLLILGGKKKGRRNCKNVALLFLFQRVAVGHINCSLWNYFPLTNCKYF